MGRVIFGDVILRGGESKVSLRKNAAGGCRKCPGVLEGVCVCVRARARPGVLEGVCVCVCVCTMLGMSGNFSEQILRSICSGECQVEAAGLISHQPPSIVWAVIRERKPSPSDKAVLHSVGHSKLHQTVPMQKPFKNTRFYSSTSRWQS